jgi:hypothetical protein
MTLISAFHTPYEDSSMTRTEGNIPVGTMTMSPFRTFAVIRAAASAGRFKGRQFRRAQILQAWQNVERRQVELGYDTIERRPA